MKAFEMKPNIANQLDSISYTSPRHTAAGEWTVAMECADTPRRLKSKGINPRRMIGLRLERTETAINVTVDLALPE